MRTPSLAITAATATLLACGSVKLPDPGSPYEAYVVHFVPPAGDPTAAGTFTFASRALPSLTSLALLEGAAFKIVEGGELVASKIQGSLVESKQFTGARAPRLNYRADGKKIVPLDYNTMTMLSAYAQFEDVFGAYAGITGIDDTSFRAWLGQAPILFEPRVRVDGGDGTVLGTSKLNAAYIPGARQFVLFQRSRVEQVPLAANLQVIAHEFGHALFEYLFFAGKYDKCGRLEQEMAVRGINEGLADFFSFAVTGSTDILRGSFNLPAKSDERNFGRIGFRYATSLSADAAPESPVTAPVRPRPRKIDLAEASTCAGGFYCIGTLFANALYDTMKELGGDPADPAARAAFVKRLVEPLRKVREGMLAQAPELFPPNSALSKCADVKEDFSYDGIISGSFLHAFLENADDALRVPLCRKLETNFGVIGFPAPARKGPCG